MLFLLFLILLPVAVPFFSLRDDELPVGKRVARPLALACLLLATGVAAYFLVPLWAQLALLILVLLLGLRTPPAPLAAVVVAFVLRSLDAVPSSAAHAAIALLLIAWLSVAVLLAEHAKPWTVLARRAALAEAPLLVLGLLLLLV